MSPKTAQRIFLSLVLIAIPTTLWPLWDLWEIFQAVNKENYLITVDTGIFYLWLMSVFFTLYFIQRKGLKEGNKFNGKRASLVLVTHFIVILLIANILPIGVAHWLSENDYHLCPNNELSRSTSRSMSLQYIRNSCD